MAPRNNHSSSTEKALGGCLAGFGGFALGIGVVVILVILAFVYLFIWLIENTLLGDFFGI